MAFLSLSLWRQAVRSLIRRPAFLLAVTLTLALSTAVTAAMAALVDTVLLKPLPFPDPERLVTVFEASPSVNARVSLVAPARLDDWQRRSTSFEALSGSYGENVTDTGGREPEQLAAVRVAPRFFDVYARPPLAGRYFTDDEEQLTGPGAAVISEGLWQRRYGRADGALGQRLLIAGQPVTIVGIVSDTFDQARGTDVWLPARIPPGLMRVRAARFLRGIGRLKPGVSVEAAAGEMAAVQAGLAREFPETDDGWSVTLRPLAEARTAGARRGLVILLGSVALLWLIAVANVAGLMVMQTTRRLREVAVRLSLGASVSQAAATIAAEGVAIAALGGAAGAVGAAWLVRLMPAVLVRTPRIEELVFDWRAAALVVASGVIAAVGCGVLPALAAVGRTESLLQSAGPRGGVGGRHRLQRAAVVLQVALSLAILASAAVLLRAYYRLEQAAPGFDARGAITFRVAARWDEDRAAIGRLQASLLSRLRDLPQVTGVGMTSFLPATGATLRTQVTVDGIVGPDEGGRMTVGSRIVDGGYPRPSARR
ncbi:MAG: ABC transporter permease [Vicinamibacterales bacterium]